MFLLHGSHQLHPEGLLFLRHKEARRKIWLHKVNAYLNAQLTFLLLGGLGQGIEDMCLPQSKASPLERRKGKGSVHQPLL